MSPTRKVWRGVVVDELLYDLLVDLAAAPDLPYITPTQGSFSTSVGASAETHAGGGAVDLSIHGWTPAQVWSLLTEGRRRGLALWHRTTAQGFTPHCHGVMSGNPYLSGVGHPVAGTAAWQATEYKAGLNGLAGAARGKDDGPDGYRDVTWWTYRAGQGGKDWVGVIVKAGATLSAIAAAAGLTLPQLLGVNPQITNPKVIVPGQTITLPPGATVPPGYVPVPVPGPTAIPTPAPVAVPAPRPAPTPPRKSTARATTWLRYAAAHRGAHPATVRAYQAALRLFVGRNTARRLNPAGATGTYGPQTRALTRAAYRKLGLPASSTPGPVLLMRLGVRA